MTSTTSSTSCCRLLRHATPTRPHGIPLLLGAAALFANAVAGQAGSYASGPKLFGTGAVGAAGQGLSSGLSADGNTVIVGGGSDDQGAGAAWIFTRSEGVWTQHGDKLVGSGAAGAAGQGRAVALSADGDTAILGGGFDDGSAGAAWIFTRSGGAWTQQGDKLVGTGASGPAGQGFMPSSVALSADGSTAIVGGPFDASDRGAAWVFSRVQDTWVQQGDKLVGHATGTVRQGYSVALSGDGSTALIGGPNDSAETGAAWVFTRSNGVWSQQGDRLIGTGAVGAASQGRAVSLSADGNTAIVGGSLDNGSAGAVWVFTRSGDTWTQQGDKLVGTGAVGAASQGRAAGLSADGNAAIVGGAADTSGEGAAWVFTRSGSVWTQLGPKLVGTGVTGGANQGRSVALSADINTVLVGGPTDNGQAGAAWVFMRVCTVGGDANGDGAANVSDVLFLINFLFAGGPAPPACP